MTYHSDLLEETLDRVIAERDAWAERHRQQRLEIVESRGAITAWRAYAERLKAAGNELRSYRRDDAQSSREWDEAIKGRPNDRT